MLIFKLTFTTKVKICKRSMSMLKNQKMFTWLRFCIAAYVFNKKTFTQHMQLFTFIRVSNWGGRNTGKGWDCMGETKLLCKPSKTALMIQNVSQRGFTERIFWHFAFFCSGLPWRLCRRQNLLFLRGDPRHSQSLQGKPSLLRRKEDLWVGKHSWGADLPERGLSV